MLHFKPHLVWCLNRTNETLPLKGFHTSGMFILIQVLGKLHSKEENIKRVRVMVWVDLRSRPQAGSFEISSTSGLLVSGSFQGLREFPFRTQGTYPNAVSIEKADSGFYYPLYQHLLLPASTSTTIQAGNNIQPDTKPLPYCPSTS